MNIFQTDGFVQFGTCGIFPNWLRILLIVCDIAITLAYIGIPIMLMVGLARSKKIRSLLLSRHSAAITVLFASFIVSCGATHAMRATVAYVPMYYALGVIEVVTAVVSLLTLGALIVLAPKFSFFQLSSNIDAEALQRVVDSVSHVLELIREEELNREH